MARTKLFAFLLLLALAVLFALFRDRVFSGAPESGIVTIWFYDIGQGDSALIDMGREQLLIDGGPGSSVVEKLTETMSFWDRRIEYVIGTHPHADHIDGIVHALHYFTFDHVFLPDYPYESRVYKTLVNEMDEQYLFTGDIITFNNGSTFEVLWPPRGEALNPEDANSASITGILSVYGTSLLFTGDLPSEEELEIAGRLRDVDVLKVGHHGSRTSTSETLLTLADPELAIMSLGEGNDYGHPASETLTRLERHGVQLFRTDENGDIRIQIYPDGTIRVATFSLGRQN